MTETKPRSEQIRFISDKTGEHLLDEYIEACERNGIPLSTMIDELFDENGHFRTTIFNFRIKDLGADDYTLQFRAGSYVDPEEGWIDISEDVFTQIVLATKGYRDTAQTHANTATTQAGIATTQAGISTTQAGISTTQAGNSATSAALAQRWATEKTTPISGGKYGAEYYSDLASTFPPSSTGQTAQAAWMADGSGGSGWRVPNSIASVLIPTTTDWDTLQSPGIFGANGTYTYTNAPATINGVLNVFSLHTAGRIQIFQPHNFTASTAKAALPYTRFYNGTNWSAWTQTSDIIQSWTAAQRGVITTLTDAATVTPNFNTTNNFSWTIGGNRTLAAPSNQVAGQSGIITITQDGTGGRVITWNAAYKFANGVKPSLSTAAGAVDLVAYYVLSTGNVICSFIPAVA
jgi:hypothetical protein